MLLSNCCRNLILLSVALLLSYCLLCCLILLDKLDLLFIKVTAHLPSAVPSRIPLGSGGLSGSTKGGAEFLPVCSDLKDLLSD